MIEYGLRIRLYIFYSESVEYKNAELSTNLFCMGISCTSEIYGFISVAYVHSHLSDVRREITLS